MQSGCDLFMLIELKNNLHFTPVLFWWNSQCCSILLWYGRQWFLHSFSKDCMTTLIHDFFLDRSGSLTILRKLWLYRTLCAAISTHVEHFLSGIVILQIFLERVWSEYKFLLRWNHAHQCLCRYNFSTSCLLICYHYSSQITLSENYDDPPGYNPRSSIEKPCRPEYGFPQWACHRKANNNI